MPTQVTLVVDTDLVGRLADRIRRRYRLGTGLDEPESGRHARSDQDRRQDRYGRRVLFQLAEVAVPWALFADILRGIDGLRLRSPPLPA